MITAILLQRSRALGDNTKMDRDYRYKVKHNRDMPKSIMNIVKPGARPPHSIYSPHSFARLCFCVMMNLRQRWLPFYFAYLIND